LEYMSPEQTLANPISTVSDLYSLGCVLYALLTGKPPFPARTLPELLRKHQETSPIPIDSVRQDVPDEFAQIIADLLQIRPEDRPRNASLVIKRLQAVLQSPGSDPERIDLLADTVTSFSVVRHDAVPPVKESLSDKKVSPDKESPPDKESLSSETMSSLSKSSPRFTAVTSTDFDPYEEERPRPVISLPVILISVTLLIIGLVVYYLLQPASAEVLLERITARMQERGPDRLSARQLRSAENDIRQFLSLYPNHSLADQVRSYQDELDLLEYERRLERRQHSSSRSLSPVERIYIEILAASPHNPEQTIDKLRAFIDVFQTIPCPSQESASPYRYTSNPVEIYVELARRRLQRLEQEIEGIHEEKERVIRGRLEAAAMLDATDSQRAERIRRGIVELHQHHRWARELIEELKR